MHTCRQALSSPWISIINYFFHPNSPLTWNPLQSSFSSSKPLAMWISSRNLLGPVSKNPTLTRSHDPLFLTSAERREPPSHISKIAVRLPAPISTQPSVQGSCFLSSVQPVMFWMKCHHLPRVWKSHSQGKMLCCIPGISWKSLKSFSIKKDGFRTFENMSDTSFILD